MLSKFGNGSAFSKETNSSFYIHKGEDIFIIDCGENTFFPISEYIDKNNIKNVTVAITHLHTDHFGGLSTLIYWLFYIKGIKVNILTPSANYDKINTFLKWCGHEQPHYILTNMLNDRHDIFIPNLNINVTAIETSHTHNQDCFGFAIVGTEESVYFSGDSVILPEQIRENHHMFDKIYQDLTLAHFPYNVHMSTIVFETEYPTLELRKKVVPYHFKNIEDEIKIKDSILKSIEKLS